MDYYAVYFCGDEFPEAVFFTLQDARKFLKQFEKNKWMDKDIIKLSGSFYFLRKTWDERNGMKTYNKS